MGCSRTKRAGTVAGAPLSHCVEAAPSEGPRRPPAPRLLLGCVAQPGRVLSRPERSRPRATPGTRAARPVRARQDPIPSRVRVGSALRALEPPGLPSALGPLGFACLSATLMCVGSLSVTTYVCLRRVYSILYRGNTSYDDRTDYGRTDYPVPSTVVAGWGGTAYIYNV